MSMGEVLSTLRGPHFVVMGIMFARCVSQFQGAVILAERGLQIESLVLCRALVETVFVRSAVSKGGVTPEELADSDFANRRKIGNAFLSIAGDEHVDRLREFIAEHAGAEEIRFAAMATKGGMTALYRLYRYLSHFAAHPSVSAASPHFVAEPDGGGHVELRAIVEGTPKALSSANIALIMACALMERIRTSPEINAAIAALHDRDVALYAKYKPWKLDESEAW